MKQVTITGDNAILLCSERHYGGSSLEYRRNQKLVKARFVTLLAGVMAGGGKGSRNAIDITAGIKAGRITDVALASDGTLIKLGEPVCGTHRPGRNDALWPHVLEIGVDEISLERAVALYNEALATVAASREKNAREYGQYLDETDTMVWGVEPYARQTDSLAAWAVVAEGRTAGYVRVHSEEGHLRVVVVDAQHASRAGNRSWVEALKLALTLASEYVEAQA
jgi:hypothetical protein